jgi:hypothetical protein
MVFLTFLKFSLKFREQIPCREAASNALREEMGEKREEKRKERGRGAAWKRERRVRKEKEKEKKRKRVSGACM